MVMGLSGGMAHDVRNRSCPKSSLQSIIDVTTWVEVEVVRWSVMLKLVHEDQGNTRRRCSNELGAEKTPIVDWVRPVVLPCNATLMLVMSPRVAFRPVLHIDSMVAGKADVDNSLKTSPSPYIIKAYCWYQDDAEFRWLTN